MGSANKYIGDPASSNRVKCEGPITALAKKMHCVIFPSCSRLCIWNQLERIWSAYSAFIKTDSDFGGVTMRVSIT